MCAEEFYAGNRPNTHFNKIGWTNVIKKFQQRTGMRYDQKQLKNKWEKMKSEFITWKSLIEKETGIGWDNEKQTVIAPDEWWASKEKVNIEFSMIIFFI